MRGLRPFLGLLVVLIALGAYLYFVESKREVGDDNKRDKVFTVASDEIDEMTVKAESGEQTTLKKNGSDWQIVQPAALQPDSAEVSGLTTNLSTLEVQRVIDENPGDLAEYGLATPRVEIDFKAKGQDRKLLIGRKSPTGTDLYAKVGDRSRVFLISSYLDSTFNKKTFDLRDKTVMKLDRDAIETLAVTMPAKTMRFAKSGGTWRMTEPVSARADSTSVDGLVNRLNTLQMKSIAAAEPKSLAEYGLDKPAATLQLGSGSSQAALLLGKAAAEGTIYAKDQSRPMVMTIESNLMDELKKDAADFRQKDLFETRTFSATHIEVTRNGQTAAFDKAKTKNKEGQEEEKWKQVAPSAQDVDQTKLENLLSAATQARATSFVESTAKTGLDAPVLRIVIRSTEPKRDETVTFGKTGDKAFASKAGDPGAAVIESSTIDNITKALDEIGKK
jgi:uncharacterized protein DUF4340